MRKTRYIFTGLLFFIMSQGFSQGFIMADNYQLEFDTNDYGNKQLIKGSIGDLVTTHTIASKSDKDYRYIIGSRIYKFKKTGKDSSSRLCVVLTYKSKIVDQISYPINYSTSHVGGISKNEKTPTLYGVHESIIFDFGFPACGYGQYQVYTYRYKNRLFKGLTGSLYGEYDSEYESSSVYTPTFIHNQVWLINDIGFIYESGEISFVTDTTKYEWKNNQLIKLKKEPLKNMIVTNPEGTKLYYTPEFNSETDLLTKGTEIKLVQKTRFKFELFQNGIFLKGQFYYVEYQYNDESKGYGFVVNTDVNEIE